MKEAAITQSLPHTDGTCSLPLIVVRLARMMFLADLAAQYHDVDKVVIRMLTTILPAMSMPKPTPAEDESITALAEHAQLLVDALVQGKLEKYVGYSRIGIMVALYISRMLKPELTAITEIVRT